MASELSSRMISAMRRRLVKVTGGRVGWRVGRMPVLELMAPDTGKHAAIGALGSPHGDARPGLS